MVISVPLLFIFIIISIRVFCALLFVAYNKSPTGSAIWLSLGLLATKSISSIKINNSMHKNHNTPISSLQQSLKSCIACSNIRKIHKFPQSFPLFFVQFSLWMSIVSIKGIKRLVNLMMMERVFVSQEFVFFLCVFYKN